MKRENLIELVSHKLGVSVSEKNFAFDIFLQQVAQALNYEQAIELNEIGIFFPKRRRTSISARESDLSNEYKDFLIYIPGRDGENKYPESMYLAFDVPLKKKSTYEFDENVFSLGIGKPMIPITKQEISDTEDSKTSMIILRKAIESRVDEIISTGKIIKDFSFWDDILGTSKKQTVKDSHQSEKLSEENNKSYGDETDFLSDEDLKNDLQKTGNELFNKDLETLDSLLNDEGTDKITENEDTQIGDLTDDPEAGMEWDWGDQLRQEFFEDSGEDEVEKDDSVNNQDEQTENVYEDTLFENLEESLKEKTDSKFFEPPTDDVLETNQPFESQDLREEQEIKNEEVDKNLSEEAKEDLEETDLDLTEKNQELSDENEQKELPEEVEEEESEELETATELEYSESESGVGENNEDLKLSSDSGEIITEDDVLIGDLKSEVDIDSGKNSKESLRDKIFSLGKSFWIILAAFILITVFGIFYLFKDADIESGKETALIDTTASNIMADNDTSGNKNLNAVLEEKSVDTAGLISDSDPNIPVINNIPEEINEEPEPQDKEIKTAPTSDLYRNSQSEKQIKSTLFFDGAKYNFQVSSWKNKEKAENEVERLRNLGFEAFIVEAYLKNLGGTWYRVRIGFFDSESEIVDFRKKNNI